MTKALFRRKEELYQRRNGTPSWVRPASRLQIKEEEAVLSMGKGGPLTHAKLVTLGERCSMGVREEGGSHARWR